jgi:hypothetical protein
MIQYSFPDSFTAKSLRDLAVAGRWLGAPRQFLRAAICGLLLVLGSVGAISLGEVA